MDKTLVFIDAEKNETKFFLPQKVQENQELFVDGFLSKLSKFFGGGKYLKIHRKRFAEFISNKENLICEKIFIYTAPPFQSANPTKEEEKRKEGYDKFVSSLKKENIIVREGRGQRLRVDNSFIYKQKGVDSLLVLDLMNSLIDYSEIKKIILIASDSDFIPIINLLRKKSINVILYTYYEKGRKARFSTSNPLIKSVNKYIKLTKEDFLNIKNGN